MSQGPIFRIKYNVHRVRFVSWVMSVYFDKSNKSCDWFHSASQITSIIVMSPFLHMLTHNIHGRAIPIHVKKGFFRRFVRKLYFLQLKDSEWYWVLSRVSMSLIRYLDAFRSYAVSIDFEIMTHTTLVFPACWLHDESWSRCSENFCIRPSTAIQRYAIEATARGLKKTHVFVQSPCSNLKPL